MFLKFYHLETKKLKIFGEKYRASTIIIFELHQKFL